MSKIYIYVVNHDFGFAPNPFHGYCTLATCKPRIRNKAEVEDWVIGVGGRRLKATGYCVYAMRVTQKITFNEYWKNPIYFDKKPVRNGSRVMIAGDNIYYLDATQNIWCQADSYHSNPDGSTYLPHLYKDTKSNKVLISNHFFYFGKKAPLVPNALLQAIGYKNKINHRVFEHRIAGGLVEWLYNSFGGALNQVIGDPFDFYQSEKRFSGKS